PGGVAGEQLAREALHHRRSGAHPPSRFGPRAAGAPRGAWSAAVATVTLSRMPSTTPARPLDRVVLAAALLFPLLYAATALARLSYPFELEWMEGGVLAGVQRLLHGQPLYAAPSLDYKIGRASCREREWIA